jgi:hypothetical protein
MRQRLLQDHVYAALQAIHRDRRVLVVWRADVHDIRSHLFQEGYVIGISCDLIVLHGRHQPFRICVADSNQLDFLERCQGTEVND